MASRRFLLPLLFTTGLFSIVFIGCTDTHMGLIAKSHLDKAEYYQKKGSIDQAVQEYRAYIDERLEAPDQLKGENPSRYFIVIGNLLLDQNRAGDAYRSYQEAEKRGVEKVVVADRYLHLAHWYGHSGQYKEALAILQRHSFLDPDRFNGYGDDLVKQQMLRSGHQK